MADMFANTKTGDTVLLTIGCNSLRAVQVERTTSTQIVIKGVKYRRKDGQRVGGNTYENVYVSLPSPFLLAKAKRMNHREQANKLLSALAETLMDMDMNAPVDLQPVLDCLTGAKVVLERVLKDGD